MNVITHWLVYLLIIFRLLNELENLLDRRVTNDSEFQISARSTLGGRRSKSHDTTPKLHLAAWPPRRRVVWLWPLTSCPPKLTSWPPKLSRESLVPIYNEFGPFVFKTLCSQFTSALTDNISIIIALIWNSELHSGMILTRIQIQ